MRHICLVVPNSHQNEMTSYHGTVVTWYCLFCNIAAWSELTNYSNRLLWTWLIHTILQPHQPMSNSTFGLLTSSGNAWHWSKNLFVTNVLLHLHLVYLKLQAWSETNLIMVLVPLLVLLVVLEVPSVALGVSYSVSTIWLCWGH